MIFIVVKWTIKPERSGNWLAEVEEFTQGTRSEPGNIFFEWSRSVDNPNQFVLVEAFQDDAAAAHVNSDHFKKFVAWAPTTWTSRRRSSTPRSRATTGPGWRKLRHGDPGVLGEQRGQRGQLSGGDRRPAQRARGHDDAQFRAAQVYFVQGDLAEVRFLQV